MQDNREKRRREQEERRRKQVKRQKMILAAIVGGLLLLVIAVAVFVIAGNNKTSNKKAALKEQTKKEQAETKKEEKTKDTSITISAAGDCTLGTDEYFNYATGFTGKYDAVQNPAYFFEKVKPIFSKDDLTIVNMEGTLTEETARQQKKYAFKGVPEYAKILTEGSVEAANLANNHSKDYGEKSYTDTIENLDAEGITSFGYDRTALMDIKGIKVGLVGTYELAENMGCEQQMIDNVESLKEQGAQIIIVSFHWGIERTYAPNDIQVALAHSAIDHGADLVLGHHPHVLQGIENYKGKNIVYSLGNFCFGGNSGPNDMDTMIFQQTFTFAKGKLKEDNVINIIPCKLSSSYASGVNDYQPMSVEGTEKDAVMARIEEFSLAVDPQFGATKGEAVSE